TGSGLATFPALYAQYIEVVPVFVVQYSNFYLDLLLELGWPGFLAMAVILAGSFGLLVLPPSSGNAHKRRGQTAVDLRWAVFAGLVVLALQGLIDDHLFGGTGTPFLLVWPGLAVYVSGKRRRKARPFHPMWQSQRRQLQFWWRKQSKQTQAAFVTGVVVIGAVSAAAAVRPFLSQWQANLGALAMARVELLGWPTGEWDDGSSTGELATAEAHFERSLAWSPTNRTALQRVGLIAKLQQDFETAVSYLEAAHQQDETHRGVLKSLVYSYVWVGMPDQAEPLFTTLPEAGREMFIYIDWWQAHGRPDLAARAEAALTLIQSRAEDG
ncbi:MAG: hypothetical protein ACE5FD_19590, partial [Anaerolineae bacterium]